MYMPNQTENSQAASTSKPDKIQKNLSWKTVKYRSPDAPISRREKEILKLLIIGKTSSEMANELFLSLDTVKSHLKSIYLKLKVHSKEDALVVALENGYA